MTNENSPAPSADAVKKSRFKLLLVLGCFLGPLAVAFIWYYGLGAIGVTGSSVNYSPLITPVKTMTAFSQPDVDGKPINLESLNKKWTVVHLLGQDCPETCQKALYNSRQTRQALGKDAHRVQRIILSGSEVLLATLKESQVDARRALTIDPALGMQLQGIFEANTKSPYDAILIDPLGNAMMTIPVDLNPSLLLKDLKKLLKLSKIG